jgi:RNA polymerase sigma factor (TIGR02999 family)
MVTVTELLLRSQKGNRKAVDAMFEHLYGDFHQMAERFLNREPNRKRLSPTTLVHEAYFRMIDQSRVDWQGRTHFFAICARVMRRVLVDHARATLSQKRGGSWKQKVLDDELTFHLDRDEEVLALHDLLEKLERFDPRQSRIVELRFFGEMTMPEVAEFMGLGQRTVEKDWAMARAWLRKEISAEPPELSGPTP